MSERSRPGILLDVPSTEAALRATSKTWTVDRRHALVAAVLPAGGGAEAGKARQAV
jgi:hypothetical protein